VFIFVSPDPLGFAAGDENLYRYCHNSPTNYVDPTGKEDQSAGTITITIGPTKMPSYRQARILGDKPIGYHLKYNMPTPNPCPKGKITLVQVLSINGSEPRFDGPYDPETPNVWPPYGGQNDGSLTIVDKPYRPSIFGENKFDIIVCAVCTTQNPFCQKELGWITFTWYDDRENPRLVINGKTLTKDPGKNRIINVPLVTSCPPNWQEAKKNPGYK
jgi:hypothetical protein